MGASAKTQQSGVSSYTPTAEAGKFYSGVLSGAQGAVSPYNPATAKTVAGFTDPQTQAFANIGANQNIWQPDVNQASQAVANAGTGIGADDISKFFNPYQDQVIDATLRRGEQADAMARRQYTANEASQQALGGNGFGLGMGRMMGDQAAARNDTIANLSNTGWSQALAAAQADKNRGLSAGTAQAGIGQLKANLAGQDASQLLNAGNQQQAQQQAQNDAASKNALDKQLFPMQMQQWLAGIGAGIGPLTGGTTASSGSATQSQGKGVGNIIGSGLSLAAMASDERVKENEQVIGTTFDGQKIYKYNYKGDPRTQIGLMAQDVERGEHPEAVSEIGGVKHVNYDQALSGMADGGLAMPDGLMGWADIRPAQVRVPDAPDVRAPQQQQDSFDPQAAWDMGKKAGSGLESLSGKLFGSTGPAASSPAGGAMAASGLQGFGGSGGGIGGLAGLASMFGFADGGVADPLEITPEEMYALEMQESGGRDIVNPKSGAFGPRQLMPATARDPGYGVRPLDPEGGLADQRRFSDDYYGAMVRKYGGDRDAARIAYNGGPARADAWLKAGRDDSVIPEESANYYKQVAARIGGENAGLVMKAKTPEISGSGDGYSGKADKAGGGILKRVFGIDFNPLNLTEPERRALLVAGLSMMSNGDVGKGGLMGMQYLTGAEAGEAERRAAAAKMAYEREKDTKEFGLKTRAQELAEGKEAREGKQADRSFGLDLDKFNQGTKSDADKLAWEKEKQKLEAGKPSEDMREYGAYAQQELDAGRTPVGFFEYQKELKAAGRPSTNVNVSGDKKGAEEMAKLFAKRYDSLQTNAEGARTLADNLDNVERSLGSGVRTGAAGEAELGLRKIGLALGIGNAEKVAAGELIQTISNKMALQVRAPGGEGGGMPGAMSDADRQFLKDTVPGLLKTPGGNRQVIAIMRAAAERHERIFDMAVDYAESNDGQLGPAFDRAVREYVKANPLSEAVAETLKKTPAAGSTKIDTGEIKDIVKGVGDTVKTFKYDPSSGAVQ